MRRRRLRRRLNKLREKFKKSEEEIGDEEIGKSIQKFSKSNAEEYFERISRKTKDYKEKMKKKVALDLESEIKASKVKIRKPLLDKTIDTSIEIAILSEIEQREDLLDIYDGSIGNKIFWRVILPLITAVTFGGLGYIYPGLIPPGSLIIPNVAINPTKPLPPIDPTLLTSSIVINSATYGIGTLILISLVALVRKIRK
ncbi:MAG: hypothetical protein ACFE96_06780 [Candidatus Hermodarchaeota archaeon]